MTTPHDLNQLYDSMATLRLVGIVMTTVSSAGVIGFITFLWKHTQQRDIHVDLRNGGYVPNVICQERHQSHRTSLEEIKRELHSMRKETNDSFKGVYDKIEKLK